MTTPSAGTLESRIADLERQVRSLLAGDLLAQASVELDDGTVVTTDEMAQAPAAAGQALAVANGKTTTYVGDTAPPVPEGGHVIGDEWLTTSPTGSLLNTWDGTLWVPKQWGVDSLAANAVVAGTIAAGAIVGTHIAGDALDGKTITGALIRTSDPLVPGGVQRIELSSAAGLRGIDPAGVARTSIDPATGLLTATGATISGDLVSASSGPRTRLFSVTNTQVPYSGLEMWSGIATDAPASITLTSYHGDMIENGAIQQYGNRLVVAGAESNAVDPPRLYLNVEDNPAGGYHAVARLDGDLVESDAPVHLWSTLLAEGMLSSNGGYGAGGVNVGAGIAATGQIGTDTNLVAGNAVVIGSTSPSAGHAVRRDWVEQRVEGGSAVFQFPSANVTYSLTVTFVTPKASVPAVVVTGLTNAPQNYFYSVGGLTNTSFTLYGRATTSGAASCRWVAVSL